MRREIKSSAYLSVVDVVMRREGRGGQVAGDDDRLARVEHVMRRLDENIRSPDDAVLGAVASAASARRVVREVHVSSLKGTIPSVKLQIYINKQKKQMNELRLTSSASCSARRRTSCVRWIWLCVV